MRPMTRLLLALLATTLSTALAAQTVRGRLWRSTPNGLNPASALAVTLYSPQRGRSSPAYSTSEGYYYLYNVPPGRYILEIWTGRAPTTTEIMVGMQPFTDIPATTLR